MNLICLFILLFTFNIVICSKNTRSGMSDYDVLTSRLQSSRKASKQLYTGSSFPSKQLMTNLRSNDVNFGSISLNTIRYFTLGVSIYLGIQFARFVDTYVFHRNNTSTNTSNTSNNPSMTSLTSMNELNKNLLDELRHDQEELWRVAHNLHQSHIERMEILGNSTSDKIYQLEVSLNELNDEVSSKLQQALDSVASMRKDDSGESQRKMEGMEKVLVQLSKGMENNKQSIQTLKESIPNLLANHDSKVLMRLKAFSKEVKEMLALGGKKK